MTRIRKPRQFIELLTRRILGFPQSLLKVTGCWVAALVSSIGLALLHSRSTKRNRRKPEEWNKARTLGVGEWGAIAVRPGNARGQLEPGAIRWRLQKNIPYIPAPLLYQGVYYMVKTGGIITSLDPATGRILKQGRSPGALGEYYASPVAADGKVFLASTEGKITVLKAGTEWEVLAVNEIGDEIHATPALSDGRVYVRTHGALYCFSTSR